MVVRRYRLLVLRLLFLLIVRVLRPIMVSGLFGLIFGVRVRCRLRRCRVLVFRLLSSRLISRKVMRYPLIRMRVLSRRTCHRLLFVRRLILSRVFVPLSLVSSMSLLILRGLDLIPVRFMLR